MCDRRFHARSQGIPEKQPPVKSDDSIHPLDRCEWPCAVRHYSFIANSITVETDSTPRQHHIRHPEKMRWRKGQRISGLSQSHARRIVALGPAPLYRCAARVMHLRSLKAYPSPPTVADN